MTKTCAQLFEGLDSTILGNADEVVTGLAYSSKDVSPGDAFFCIVGFNVDGHTFAQDAIDKGARVIVAERKLYLADATDVTVVVVSDSRRAMAHAACVFYDHPSDAFKLVGITGTNGKTTTTYLVESIARAAGLKCGVIGTVGVKIDGVKEPSEHTTPESPDLQRIFARMREEGCDVVAMEVSSHALDLERVWGSRFAVTAFTNLTQDHLDYHHTFEAYFEAKALLFSAMYPAARVIGIGDPWGRELFARCKEAGNEVLTTGFDTEAAIHPSDVAYSSRKTDIQLSVCGNHIDVTTPLVGKFNVENAMTAFGVGLELGIDAQTIVEALGAPEPVPGRLERITVNGAEDVDVFVDYAHTPDALAKAIASVKELAKGRTIVVFGCGGDRDSTKRPIMGAAALSADQAIVTSDNPRTEDPCAIIEDIVAGMDETKGTFEVIADRALAIRTAIQNAQPDDAILIAGKGHEDYQIVGTQTLHFDDREEAAAALNMRAGR